MNKEQEKVINNLLNESSDNKDKVKNDLKNFYAGILKEQQLVENVFKGLSLDERAELVGEHIKKNIDKELFATEDDVFNEAYSWEYFELVRDFDMSVSYSEYIDEEKGDESDLLHFAVSAVPLIINDEKVLILEISGQGETHVYAHTDKSADLGFIKKYYSFEDFIKGEVK